MGHDPNKCVECSELTFPGIGEGPEEGTAVNDDDVDVPSIPESGTDWTTGSTSWGVSMVCSA